MRRDKVKSSSLHSLHEEHVEPLPAAAAAAGRTPFEVLVRELLGLLGEDAAREGLRQTPARVEASLKWLTRGYGMSVAGGIGDAPYSERHRSEEHTSELQSQSNIVCRLLLEKKKMIDNSGLPRCHACTLG